MRKTITINEKNYEMKANLGTAVLYRKLTGRDWLQDLTKIRNKETEINALDIIIEMAYCMNVQAKGLDLDEMEKLLTQKALFQWKDEEDFSITSFNKEVMREVISLWNNQERSNIEIKNQ